MIARRRESHPRPLAAPQTSEAPQIRWVPGGFFSPAMPRTSRPRSVDLATTRYPWFRVPAARMEGDRRDSKRYDHELLEDRQTHWRSITPQEVAEACAANPLAVAIPSHRVVRSNGRAAIPSMIARGRGPRTRMQRLPDVRLRRAMARASRCCSRARSPATDLSSSHSTRAVIRG
jgi:hypothetical protein